MAYIQGAFLAIEYDRTEEISYTDKNGKPGMIRKFVGLMEFAGPRSKRDFVEIMFPRNQPGFTPPKLVPGTHYLMPVKLGVYTNPKSSVAAVTYELRTDMQPVEAPDLAA